MSPIDPHGLGGDDASPAQALSRAVSHGVQASWFLDKQNGNPDHGRLVTSLRLIMVVVQGSNHTHSVYPILRTPVTGTKRRRMFYAKLLIPIEPMLGRRRSRTLA